MKLFIVILLIVFCACEKRDTNVQLENSDCEFPAACIDDQHAVQTFRAAYDTFCIKLYTKAVIRSQYYVVMSLHTVWITLAAIAEGADQYTQKEIFQFLGLPNDACTREKLYKIASTRFSPTTDYGSVNENRTLVIDSGVGINPKWNNLIQKHALLDIISAPIKSDPATTFNTVKEIVSFDVQQLDLSGNSVLLNSLDFNWLWTTAFADAVVERAPFYNEDGQQIGSVDLMRVRQRLRIGYIPSIRSKVIELPIGINGEYSMIFTVVVGNGSGDNPATKDHTISEVISALQVSEQPIDVAIPRFVIESEINLKDILEDAGIINLWKSPEATRLISNPSAHPSSYIQRTRITFNTTGINPAPQEPSYLPTSDTDKYWSEFVADKPFKFGLFDTETYTCILGAFYTQPTYPD